MAKPLQWHFEIIDKASGPGKVIAKMFADVDQAAHGASKRVAVAETGIAGFIHSFHDVAHLGEMAAHAIEFVGEKAFEMGKEIIDAVSNRETTQTAFAHMLGDAKLARDVFEDAEDFAGKTGVSIASVMETTKGFLRAGFGVDELHTLRSAMSDVGAIGGAGAMEEFAAAINVTALKGEFGERQLRALNKVGVDSKTIYEELGKIYGVTADQAKKMVSSHKIEGRAGVAALVNSVERGISKGTLGSAAKEQSTTLDGLIKRWKMLPERIYGALEGGRAHSAVKGTMENLLSLFDPDSEYGRGKLQKLDVWLNGVFGTFFDAFSGPDGMKRIQALTDKVFSALSPENLKSMTDAALGFGNALVSIAGTLPKIVSGLASMADLMTGGLADKIYKMVNPETNILAGKSRKEIVDMAHAQLRDPNSSALAFDFAKETLVKQGAASPELQADVGKVTSTTSRGGDRTLVHAPSVSVNVNVTGPAGMADFDDMAQRTKEAAEEALASTLERFSNEAGTQ